MPHKSQADLALALPAVPRSHPDYHPLNVANLILGSLGGYMYWLVKRAARKPAVLPPGLSPPIGHGLTRARAAGG